MAADTLVKVLKTADLDTEIGSKSPEIQAAIKAGDILASIETATKTVGEVKYGREYLALTPVNMSGVLALYNGVETNWDVKDEDGKPFTDSEGNELPGKFARGASIAKDVNYAFDMRARQNEGNAISSAVEDPEKQIEKAAKGLAAVLGISLEDATARVRAMKAAPVVSE